MPWQNTVGSNKWVVLVSALLLGVFGLLSLPGKGYSLANTKDLQSLTIEMRRLYCGAGCPVYTITIHGDGTVEYVGQQFVRDRGPEHLVLSQDQIHDLLKEFDRADFFRLEERAFAWGYHTPRFGVRITVDGKSKEVKSDRYDVGAESGPQARFAEAAAAIDRFVGTDRWVKCGDSRCPPQLLP